MNQLTLSECSRRRLDETYLVVYAIKNEINMKKSDYIEKSDIYTLIGIDIKGYRQFINIYQDRVNNKRFWLDCFETLKARGLQNILFLSVDNNKNMKRTAKIAFPNDSSVFKVLYLRIKELSEKWKKPIQNWKIIHSQLIELFGDRYTNYLNL